MNRIGALQGAMAEHDLDLVVVGPTSNLRYLVGYRASAFERITVLLVSQNAAAMVLPSFDRDEFVAQTRLDDAFGWTDKQGPRAALDAAFRSVGASPRNALVDDELRFDHYALLRERLGDAVGRASELFAPLRLAKDADEQDMLARAGELVALGVEVATKRAQPGMIELELKRAIEQALWNAGAETVDFVLVQAGANSVAAHHSGDSTALREGEPVLFDISARWDGYFADTTQQVFLGEPPPDYVEAYEVVAAAHAAGLAAARAGATAGDVDRAAARVIEEAGFAESSGPRTGHGIGLDLHEPPSVLDGDETELVPGAAITVEPGVYLPGRYGIRVEDTLIVTEAEPRIVTRAARPLVVKRH